MSHRRVLNVLLVAAMLGGCPAGTPKEELQRIGADIETLDDRTVRISLRGKDASTVDLSAAIALCWNHSAEYPALSELDLSQSGITDEGLEHLRMNAGGIPDLRVLDLSETDVSDEAVADLQAAGQRTAWVVDEAERLLGYVMLDEARGKPGVRVDLLMREMPAVTEPEATLKDAFSEMLTNNLITLPVLDEEAAEATSDPPPVVISRGLSEAVGVNQGDEIYICDTRWWLGGLNSTHALIEQVSDADEPRIEMDRHTFRRVVTPRRKNQPVRVERSV